MRRPLQMRAALTCCLATNWSHMLDPHYVIEVTLNNSGTGSKHNKSDEPAGNTVRINELSDDTREAVIRGRRMVESLLNSHYQFVDRSVTDLMAAISKTGAGLGPQHGQ